MSQFLDWKYVSFDHVDLLEKTTDVVSVKAQLRDIFSLNSANEAKNQIAVDYYYYCYMYAEIST